ncbi:HEPN domain-containing protein [Proteiniclasticum sp.]|uniref:HEPN domain-containing protein n=1 Tax=Proteiniclasticum sp. TaxID=2053595 RepID=UPI0028990511|nr:HEPN domain-containing protein [Proteiniclasticum sp.]
MPTNNELKYLSERRLSAVQVLTDNSLHDIAYHDSGYIIEFGLKAIICKKSGSEEYPSSKEYYTHHFDSLVRLAGLEEELAIKKATDREFMKNWSVATKWSVQLRYRPIGHDDKSIVESFINAIRSDKGGVLPWLKLHW